MKTLCYACSLPSALTSIRPGPGGSIKNWPEVCDSVADNFSVINSKFFSGCGVNHVYNANCFAAHDDLFFEELKPLPVNLMPAGWILISKGKLRPHLVVVTAMRWTIV